MSKKPKYKPKVVKPDPIKKVKIKKKIVNPAMKIDAKGDTLYNA